MTNKRKLYTDQELKDLHAWFDAQALPKGIRIDKSTYIPDLAKTLKILLGQSVRYRLNTSMQGGIILLGKIKNKLEEMQQQEGNNNEGNAQQ